MYVVAALTLHACRVCLPECMMTQAYGEESNKYFTIPRHGDAAPDYRVTSPSKRPASTSGLYSVSTPADLHSAQNSAQTRNHSFSSLLL